MKAELTHSITSRGNTVELDIENDDNDILVKIELEKPFYVQYDGVVTEPDIIHKALDRILRAINDKEIKVEVYSRGVKLAE